ncbi:MAG TPA: hypothetical protein VEB64_12510 [Azospirillaceae bacterium]|nr:hypothetical protein [Azospirillaceae bacterium]
MLIAEQVVPGAPYQIRAADLKDARIVAGIGRKGQPCRLGLKDQLSMFSDT